MHKGANDMTTFTYEPRGSHYSLTAQHPTGMGPKLHAKAANAAELVKLYASLRAACPGYRMTVENKLTGEVHTYRH
jgi:hypothetical protein